MKEIFPDGAFGTPLYDAAWETYIGHVSVYDDVFKVLHDQYAEAIKKIGMNTKKNARLDRDDRLAEHLMILFGEELKMSDANGLLATFWKTADEDTRAHAIDFLGRSLLSIEESLSEEEARLLKDLWESENCSSRGRR